ncbi:MAG: class I SAM-dependent methyltransferase [Myxococcales bacterium]|nr:class I SAM-dependent methyltransferase [Myxococcales bacterium]
MSLPRFLLRQLSRPDGWFGSVTAWLLNRSNRVANERAVQALELQPDQCALDLGFGGGVALPLLLSAVPQGEVIAVDPSESMVRRAERQHRRAVAAGRLRVMVGSAEGMEVPSASVHGVLSVNTLYFWPDLAVGLAEVRRILAPGGRFVAVVAHRGHCEELGFQDMGFRTETPEFYAEAMGDAGFTVSVEDVAHDAVLIRACPHL